MYTRFFRKALMMLSSALLIEYALLQTAEKHFWTLHGKSPEPPKVENLNHPQECIKERRPGRISHGLAHRL